MAQPYTVRVSPLKPLQGEDTDKVKLDYYDRATNQKITPETRPKMCIEPVGRITGDIDGRRYAALINLKTHEIKIPIRRSVVDRLKRQQRYYTETAFDLLRAKRELEQVWRQNG